MEPSDNVATPVVAEMLTSPKSSVEAAFGTVWALPLGSAPMKATVERWILSTVTENPTPVELPSPVMMEPVTPTSMPPECAVIVALAPPVTSAPWVSLASMPA